MPRTRQARRKVVMAADIHHLNDKVKDMSTSLYAELNKLKENVKTRDAEPNLSATSRNGSADELDDQMSEESNLLVLQIARFEEKLNSCFGEITQEIKNLTESYDIVHKRLNGCVLKANNKSIIIYGIPEERGEKLVEKLCSLINDRFDISIKPDDIDDCFRIGKRTAVGKKPQPVEVQFISCWKRNLIFANKKLLKNTGFVFAEKLTKEAQELFALVRRKVGIRSCWTWRGKVFISLNHKKICIDDAGRLDEVLGSS